MISLVYAIYKPYAKSTGFNRTFYSEYTFNDDDNTSWGSDFDDEDFSDDGDEDVDSFDGSRYGTYSFASVSEPDYIQAKLKGIIAMNSENEYEAVLDAQRAFPREESTSSENSSSSSNQEVFDDIIEPVTGRYKQLTEQEYYTAIPHHNEVFFNRSIINVETETASIGQIKPGQPGDKTNCALSEPREESDNTKNIRIENNLEDKREVSPSNISSKPIPRPPNKPIVPPKPSL